MAGLLLTLLIIGVVVAGSALAYRLAVRRSDEILEVLEPDEPGEPDQR